jgi:hypothetical protein
MGVILAQNAAGSTARFMFPLLLGGHILMVGEDEEQPAAALREVIADIAEMS